ncbi:bifunctional preprotein translocase subunit SecD/SecF [Spiroplasma gladiatoris]|uniref:Bifunctional preprotein translocase subunit SecD/SecF n=1 Tax=Spiroplasma gladiatoris TaxID=2143 RepID=A0A4V1AQ87_9MOLU|nr:protein translocase SecDF, variant type [Spiroplasma gladiatoris]QBQ07639.1 bifunctional preprotein translocase subunit SecD/SecF [Spiroplasma gladiatoris]
MVKKNSPKTKLNKSGKFNIFRFCSIFIILASLLVGIFFSTERFTDKFRLGSDFKGYYSALVAVNNVNKEAATGGQPNGDSKEAAKVLEERLNPMGTNQITIETAGLNYLKVLSPVEAYDSETQFKNQIQRNGGAILLNEKYEDYQLKIEDKKITRSGITDYFSEAKTTAITSGSSKSPAIQFKLNGTKFSDIFSEQETSVNMKLMVDADGFYNEIRNYYNTVKKDKTEDKIASYFDQVITPMRNLYKNSDTEELQKSTLSDLFAGTYEEIDTGGNKRNIYTNLLDEEVSQSKFLEYVNSNFKFLSETSKYVYDPNAKSEDFNGEEAKYANDIEGYNNLNSYTKNKLGKIADVFKAINTIVGKYWDNQKSTMINNEKAMSEKIGSYILYSGAITKQQSNNSLAYIDGSNLKIIFYEQPESAARTGAAVFNASTKGFVFTVNNILKTNPSVTSLMLQLAIIFLGVVALALLIYSLFLYRILGLFMIVVILAITTLTLMSTTWFGLTLGIEAIIAVAIIVSINLEIFSMIFENMKFNLYVKQRNIKTSYNISIKENITLAIDVLIALIIPSISLFWITSNAIQSFAIIILMGVVFTLLFTVLLATILNKLLISTNIFNNKPELFALNTDFVNQGKVFLQYKIRNTKNKIQKLKQKNRDTSAYEQKLVKLEEKLNIKIETAITKQKALLEKYNQKINKKISEYETKLNKIIDPKKATKKMRIEFKINELKYLLEEKVDVEMDEESDVVLNTQDKIKIKSYEKTIRHGSKFVLLALAVFSIVTSILGGLKIPNLDSSFGNRVEYTLWGTKLESMYNGVRSFSQKSSGSDELKEKVTQMLEEKDITPSNSDEKPPFATVVYSFLDIVFSNEDYLNSITDSIGNSEAYKFHNYAINYGNNFNYVSSSTNDDIQWVTLSVISVTYSDSYTIKNLFAEVGGFNKTQEIDSNGGFVAKRIRPYTIVDMAIQMAYGVLAIVLALAIYILIRFKWTYYIAMVIGIILVPVLTLGAIVSFYIPLGMTSLIAVAVAISFTCLTMFMLFGKVRNLIANKDENSMINFFKKEIEYSIEVKNMKKKIKDEIFLKKADMKLKAKEKKLSKEERNDLKLEFKKFKQQKYIEYKEVRKNNKVEINKVSKRNNYLKEIMVQSFKYGIKRSLLIGVFYIIISLLLSITLTSLASFGLSVIIGIVSSGIIMLFICLPVWIWLEQIRIRNHLTRKRFINGLKVTGEEQIIEGVND